MSVLAAVGLVAGGAITVAAPATAAGTCSLYVPSRVSMGQPYRGITVRLGPNCSTAGVTWANWDGYHPTQGIQEILIFDHTSSDIWNLYDFDAIGRWQWRPEGAHDSNYDDVFQYGPYYTDIRLASYGRVSATRIGGRINLKTQAMRYWQSGSRFIGWSGARGQIQYRVNGGTVWHPLKDVYSNSSGAYSYTYTIANTRDYRVVFNAVSTIWDSTSPTVRK